MVETLSMRLDKLHIIKAGRRNIGLLQEWNKRVEVSITAEDRSAVARYDDSEWYQICSRVHKYCANDLLSTTQLYTVRWKAENRMGNQDEETMCGAKLVILQYLADN